MTQALSTNGNGHAAMVERVSIIGDLSQLSAAERVQYYAAVCQSLGLNPLTKPFDYLQLNSPDGDGKRLVLYAKRDATDQLRTLRGVSVQIVSREVVNDVYVVTARATDNTGRSDESIGAVPLVKEGGEWKTAQSGKRYFASDGTMTALSPDARANAMMKAETKAKRRVTLSICGLGMLDESEIDTIAGAQTTTTPEPTTIKPVSADNRAIVSSLIDQHTQLNERAKNAGTFSDEQKRAFIGEVNTLAQNVNAQLVLRDAPQMPVREKTSQTFSEIGKALNILAEYDQHAPLLEQQPA